MNKSDFEKAILAEVEWCRKHYGFSGDDQEKYELGFIAGLNQAILIIRQYDVPTPKMAIEDSTLSLKTCNSSKYLKPNDLLQ